MQANVPVTLDDASADFLAQLAQDAGLRAAVERDPVATLARFGIEIDPADVPAQVVLPAVDQLSSLRASDMPTSIWSPFIDAD